MMLRSEMTSRVASHPEPWDIIVIGGGATGLGIAIDGASRGYDTLLVEQSDFGKGTSSRSTKLIHGGVRYLGQGNVALVREALEERGLLRQNAPHLVHDLGFVIPQYHWWEAPYYGIGLKLYDALARKHSFGGSRILSRNETLASLPAIQSRRLRGGILYYDGQFDDARLLINMAATAAEQGAVLLNYAPLTGFLKTSEGRIDGVSIRDLETSAIYHPRARMIINATGAFTDNVRRLADPSVTSMIVPSQGIHLVFDKTFLPGKDALMIPRTTDGRVLFSIPWHDHAVIGTTDTPIPEPTLEPAPFNAEIEFILRTAASYLQKAPTRRDVLSVFTGIRPLVKSAHQKNTAALSRDYTIAIDKSGLLNITGGKWTTYRRMAENCVNQAATLANLPQRKCVTRDLRIHGYHAPASQFGPLAIYGSDAPAIQALIQQNPALAAPLSTALPYTAAEVVWAARHEMARTVEDVLARRTRALFLDTKAALESAGLVASLLARELNRDGNWEAEQLSLFTQTAAHYTIESAHV